MSGTTMESLSPETETILSAEAQYFAYHCLASYEGRMSGDSEISEDDELERAQFLEGLHIHWQEVMEQLAGTDYVYITKYDHYPYHALGMNRLMHDAMLAGYGVAERADADFMWDEVLQLSYDHPGVNALLRRYGFYTDHTTLPTVKGWHLGHVLPRSAARQVIGTMYDIGRQYRAIGWGYPWWSEPAELIEGAV